MPVYIKNEDEWQEGVPYIRNAYGWKPSQEVWQKVSGVWQKRVTTDTTAPGRPTLVLRSSQPRDRRTRLVVKMPGDADLSHATLKFSSTSYPTSESGSTHIYESANYNPSARQPATPYQDVSWMFTPGSYNRTYYVSVWAVDTAGNASDRMMTSFSISPPDTASPAPTTPVVSKITYNCVTSGSFQRRDGYWNGGYFGDLVVQAGQDNYMGGWFYGTKISSALSKKTKINKFTIRIQRVNSQHGVSAGANIWLVPHTLSTEGQRGTRTPVMTNPVSPVNVGTLTRGQAKTFNVPSAWWPGFLSGKYKGLALYYGSVTNWSSYHYVNAYGQGTTSGQVYIEAQ